MTNTPTPQPDEALIDYQKIVIEMYPTLDGRRVADYARFLEAVSTSPHFSTVAEAKGFIKPEPSKTSGVEDLFLKYLGLPKWQEDVYRKLADKKGIQFVCLTPARPSKNQYINSFLFFENTQLRDQLTVLEARNGELVKFAREFLNQAMNGDGISVECEQALSEALLRDGQTGGKE